MSRRSASTAVITAICGDNVKKERSNSSASTTTNSLLSDKFRLLLKFLEMPPRKALQSSDEWCRMCASIVDVVVLPCVPATHNALCMRVMSPKSCERFLIVNPFFRNQTSSAMSAGTAGV